jgi:hypothetical protein
MQSSFLRSLNIVAILFPLYYLPITVQSFRIPQFFPATPSISQRVTNAMTGAMVALSIGTSVLPASASDSRIIGQIAGSGLVFKDTLVVESFEDPKVRKIEIDISFVRLQEYKLNVWGDFSLLLFHFRFVVSHCT